MITCIRRLPWLIGYDDTVGSHSYLKDGDLAFENGTILQVGGHYEGAVDKQVDGRNFCAMPGLINAHTHPSNQPSFRGVREDLGNPNFYQSGLYDGRTAFVADVDQRRWNARMAYWEMLKSGVTTVVDMSFPYPGWIDAASDSGLRVYVAPLFQDRKWSTADGIRLHYLPEAVSGEKALQAALDLIALAERDGSGRLVGLVAPMAVDVCEPGLIKDGLAAARRLGRPFQLHVGESVLEFQEMTRRNGKTQVQWLDELELLGPDVILGHGLFLGHHPWLHWDFRGDIGILARHQVSVSHCPTVFGRYGITLDSFGGYARAGINMSIGTDTHPHNMIEEMRHAAIHARIAEGRISGGLTADVFNAATLGGARALMREDIGRLAPGARADIVLLDLSSPWMQPIYDPVRCLVHTAADRAVSDVYVDGRLVVDGGEVATMAIDEVARHVSAMQAKAVERASTLDHSGRAAQQIAPMSFAISSVH
ncbi:amidohydrolase family protein [Geminicoccaceae bacterium 1502E]|nr:amidohydrolase family protein [Geminicoccaceae bacterium 1502E]